MPLYNLTDIKGVRIALHRSHDGPNQGHDANCVAETCQVWPPIGPAELLR